MHRLENITLLSALGTLTQIWSDTETKVNRKKKVKLMQINMVNMRLEHMSHNLSEQTEGARAESDSYSFLNKW